MIRAVLDTNVIISGILNREGSPGRLIQAAFEHQAFQAVTSVPILGEIGSVLRRPRIARRHGWSELEIGVFLARLYTLCLVVEGLSTLDAIAADPSDNMFLAAALEAEAGYVVSGDDHLLALGMFENIVVLSPRQFLDLLPNNLAE